MIKLCFKFILAFGLILWLFKSGKIDFSLLVRSFENESSWIICFLILFCNICLITWRWKKILELKSQKTFSFPTILKLTWIGNMFNTVLPGAVSGDIIKLLYAHNLDRSLTKTYLVTSVILDRAIGLFGLLLLMAFFSLFNYQGLAFSSPQVAGVIHLNFLFAFGMLLFFCLFFISPKYQNKILELCSKIPLTGKTLIKTLPQVWIIGKHRKVMLGLLALSVLTQTLSILAFWYLAFPFLEYTSPLVKPITLAMGFTFIPLGFVAMALPITPAGLGVGHAVFSTLFSYFGIINGASLFNFHLFANVSMNLFGIIPYLFSGVKHSPKEVAEFETLT